MGWQLDTPAAIAGQGTVLLPMQAALLELSTVPDGMGSRVGEPELFYDLGYVVWLVEGAGANLAIVRLDAQWVNEAPAGAAGIAYSLLPGVSGLLYPAYWVPGTGLSEGRLAPAGIAAGTGWFELG